MPSHMNGTDRSFLADMMPWSDAYRAYEAEQKYEAIHNDFFDAEPPKPKTPPQCRRPLDGKRSPDTRFEPKIIKMLEIP